MKYGDFICFIQAEAKERLGEGVHVELHQIIKNNSVLLDGLSVQEKDKGVAPTIYLNDFYEEYQKGMTVPEILDCIVGIYEKSKVEKEVDMGFYMDYDKVKQHLACKIISKEKNEKLLNKIPYVPFLDLALVPYYKMTDSEMGNGTILVFESHRKNWGISPEQLIRDARENTLRILPWEMMSMESVLKGFVQKKQAGECPEGEKEKGLPMYVLTNQENYFGAVNLVFDSVLAEAGTRLGEDFWILPSSVHECILVPASVQMGKEKLEDMVRQVNEKEVAPEDYLSDSVYFYERSLHKLQKM